MPRRNPIPLMGARQQAPRYRFWGNTRPPEHRDPIRAQLSTADDGAGTATMRLYAPIDSWGGMWGVSATEFAEALDALDESVGEIRLHINSPGGEVYEGIAILNQLRQHPANVVAINDGIAASAASFIACGADELIMGQNSELMIHDAWGICIGPAVDMHDTGNLLDRISANIASVYQAKAGEDVEFWRAAMLAETWYGDREAVDAGLADRVDGDEADDAENGFDLTQFRHQGRADAPAPPKPGEDAPKTERDDDTAVTALQERRHRMNARRPALPL